tara:strand:- start:1776 stop:1988 length:213 start_codon:yes stop_codon:yes gene_type:complete
MNNKSIPLDDFLKPFNIKAYPNGQATSTFIITSTETKGLFVRKDQRKEQILGNCIAKHCERRKAHYEYKK